MDAPYVQDGIRYEFLTRQRCIDAALCVSEVFANNEPLAHHLGVTMDEMFSFTSRYYPLIVKDELSVVAIDEATNECVGARVTEDYVQPEPPPDLFDRISPRLVPVFSFLDHLSEKFKRSHNPKRGHYIHMFMVAVKKPYTNRGIAPRMNLLAFQRALDCGYTHAVTEPTGCISQHILRDKFGFSVIHEESYETFEINGTRVFSGMTHHKSGMLMVKDIRGIVESSPVK